MLKVKVILGSVRDGRMGIRAAKYAIKASKKYNWDVELIDPQEYKLPLLQKMYKSMKEPDGVYQQLHEKFEEADGFLMITAEYNHSVPPALKNMLDHYQREFFFKPSAILSYSAGSFGGVRATEHLRGISAELGMPSIPSSFPVPNISKNLDEDGNTSNENYEKFVKKFFDEFEWYMQALKHQRAQGLPY